MTDISRIGGFTSPRLSMARTEGAVGCHSRQEHDGGAADPSWRWLAIVEMVPPVKQFSVGQPTPCRATSSKPLFDAGCTRTTTLKTWSTPELEGRPPPRLHAVWCIGPKRARRDICWR